ncbi:hypothetical protein HDU92_003127 [Lobulomyces angularis]|nr:hypothetical protein HDU92_003127 [Lobulomyces angularis]
MEKINGGDSISPYFLYTIITDLDAIEIPKAVKSFLLASGLPVSIYVIGFSETKFPNLEAIFSEISANSSSLLSVRFKFLKSDEYEGVSDVQDALIKNIPEQIMHFMKSICISPDIIRINNNEKEKSKELTKKCSETFVPDIPKEEFSSRRPSKISPCPSRNSTSMVLTNFSDSSKGGFANPNLPLNEAADFRLSSVFNRRESELYQDAHFSEGRRRSVSVSSGGLRPRNSSSVRPTTMVFLDEMLSGNSLDPYQPRAVRQQNNNRFSAIFLDELLRSNTVTRDFPLSDTLVEAKAGNQDVLAKELNGGVMVPGEDLFSPSATITSFNSCKESNFENFEKNFNLINNKIENLEAKMETNFKNLERIISILGKNLHSITDKLSRLGSIQNNSMRNMNLQDRKFFASDFELDETFTNEIMLDKNNTEKQSVSLFSGRNEVTN